MKNLNSTFKKRYNRLNLAQKQAVDKIDGAVLVIAGPGTGKTELLSMRVANILQKTDANPNNILCMTFTESGASNMRERLSSMIGAKAAYEINISTYHGFGQQILRENSQYLDFDSPDEIADDLQKYTIIKNLYDSLPKNSLLKKPKSEIYDIQKTIADFKKENLSPNQIREIALENIRQTDHANNFLKSIESPARMSGKLEKDSEIYMQILSDLKIVCEDNNSKNVFGSNIDFIVNELESAFYEANETGKSKPLNAWKTAFLDKDNKGNFQIKDTFANKKLLEFTGFFEKYENEKSEKNLYDFDDLILRAISLLEKNQDLKYTLQEKYQYILLDEYQDTNDAQAKIVELLTVNDLGLTPNVLAVGDDDQGIMAFQGANYSNMLNFANNYQNFGGCEVINLTQNYRSAEEILDFAQNIADQIPDRLDKVIPELNKQIIPNRKFENVKIERMNFTAAPSEFNFVAEKISKLLENGEEANEIAILAPKHKILEEAAKYLTGKNIPIKYEKRENILEELPIIELEKMANLVVNLAENPSSSSDHLWPEILSFDFWNIPALEIFKISQTIYAKRFIEETSWLNEMLKSENENIQKIAEFFWELSLKSKTENCEIMLDFLIGNKSISENFTSPFKAFYSKNENEFYNIAIILTILRDKLSSYKNAEKFTNLADFSQMIEKYNEAGIKIINSNPYTSGQNSVQMMTAFSAKGLEFTHTFLLNVDNETWSATKNNDKFVLPKNFAKVRYSGQESEKLRLLFVAITRAKNNLYLTSSSYDFLGRKKNPLKFLDEDFEENLSRKMPADFQNIVQKNDEIPSLETLNINWKTKFNPETSEEIFKQILLEKVNKFKFSASSLTSFYDLQYGGPQKFYENYILNFPQGQSEILKFGTTIHETLDFISKAKNKTGQIPEMKKIEKIYTEKLAQKKLSESEFEENLKHGKNVLNNFMKFRSKIFEKESQTEVKISQILLDDNIILGGNIDRIEIDEDKKEIEIVDFKTGEIAQKATFKNSEKLHKYETQLYFYKILLERSPDFKKYKIKNARLEFIEGNSKNNFEPEIRSVELTEEGSLRVENLIRALNKRMMDLNFTDDFDNKKFGIKHILEFEDSQIGGL